MARFLLYLGQALMALPFVVMAAEVAYAHLTGATGERMMAAGFWGVFVGYFTFVPGLILAVIGAVWCLLE